MDISFVPIVALGLVVYTLLNAIKFLLNRQWNALLTLVLGWIAGVAAVWLFGATAWGPVVTIGEKSLDALSFADKMVVGLVVVSTGSALYDLKRAFDGTDSAATPPLTGGISITTRATPEQRGVQGP
jgi:hypothetical protein